MKTIQYRLRLGFHLIYDAAVAPLQLQFHFGNKGQPQGARLGEYGECGTAAILFSVKKKKKIEPC